MARLTTAVRMAVTLACDSASLALAAVCCDMATSRAWRAAAGLDCWVATWVLMADTAWSSSVSEAFSSLIFDASSAFRARAASRLRRADEALSAATGEAMPSTSKAISAATGMRRSFRMRRRRFGNHAQFQKVDARYWPHPERCKPAHGRAGARGTSRRRSHFPERTAPVRPSGHRRSEGSPRTGGPQEVLRPDGGRSHSPLLLAAVRQREGLNL